MQRMQRIFRRRQAICAVIVPLHAESVSPSISSRLRIRGQFLNQTRKERTMGISGLRWLLVAGNGGGIDLCDADAAPAESACCYFSAKDKDILQPAQKVFLT